MIRVSDQSRRLRSRVGFTLVELMVVVVIMGIVTVSVIPAMDNLGRIREGAARDDLMRMLEIAKGRAAASGMPHGLQVNLNDSSATIVEITSQGAIQVETDPLTNRNRTISIPNLYSGVTMSSMINGDGVGGSGIIWFDFKSNPHTRTPQGDFVSLNSQVASIELSSGEFIAVYPHSGMLEVQY